MIRINWMITLPNYSSYKSNMCNMRQKEDELSNGREFRMSDDGDIVSADLLRGINCDLNSNSSDGRENRGKYSAICSDESTLPANLSYAHDGINSISIK